MRTAPVCRGLARCFALSVSLLGCGDSEGAPGPLASGADRAESSGAPAASASPSERSIPNPDPNAAAREQALRDARDFGMEGLISQGSAYAPWGSASAFGPGMWGDDVSDEFGDGLSGRTGGGAARRGKPPSVRKGEVVVSGKLPPEVVQRIVRQNFGRFRLCYENGLRTDPKLGGKVSISFTIRRNGTVEGSTATTDLANQEVAACMARALDGVTFPEPEGGVVKVLYTVLLAPAEPATDAKP